MNEMDEDGLYDTWLRVDEQVPVLTTLLDFFSDLPPCETAHVSLCRI